MSQRFLSPERCIESLGEKSLGKVLDYGAGVGFWNNALAPRSQEIVSVEPNGLLLRSNRIPSTIVCGHNKVCAPLEKTTIKKMFKPHEFDTVLLSNVLSRYPEHVHDEIISSVHELVRPGGKVIVIDREQTLDFNQKYISGIAKSSVESSFKRIGFKTSHDRNIDVGDFHFGFIMKV